MIIKNIKIFELDKLYKSHNCIFKKCKLKDECILTLGFDKTNIIGRVFNFKKKKKEFYCDIEVISDEFEVQIEYGNMSLYPCIQYIPNKTKKDIGIRYIKNGELEYIGLGNVPHADNKLTGNAKKRLSKCKKRDI